MAAVTPLIVITGPTASGKTGLALELAERYHGEIICADSRTVYKGMDIGTAKPTAEERARVPHHIVDVVEPHERFTAGEFQSLARKAIADIRARGSVPFLVGGTGLYIDSVVLNYTFSEEKVDFKLRRALEQCSPDELVTLLKDHQVELPKNLKNKRHLIRAWELRGVNHLRRDKPEEDVIVVAISTEKSILEQRIRDRAHEMFAAGVLDEARQLSKKYGWDAEALTGNIYPILRKVLEGEMSEAEAIERFIVRDRQLVKRQLTWLRRHDFVRWLTLEKARDYVSHILDRAQE